MKKKKSEEDAEPNLIFVKYDKSNEKKELFFSECEQVQSCGWCGHGMR